MATRKVTIALEEDQLQGIREYVSAGKASSASAFIQHAVKIALFDAAGWRVMLDEALRETGGPLTTEECAWADLLLDDPKPSMPRVDRSGPG